MVSLNARRELVCRWRSEYALAGKARKGEILDSLVEATGWNRRYAMSALRCLLVQKPGTKRKRKRIYGPNEEAALVRVWKLSDFLTGKRLNPFMQEFLECLERHGELTLPEPTRSKLIKMSATTIDRFLGKHRSSRPKAYSLTKPGLLLKRQVEVRTANAWEDTRPGFMEVDAVSHCGGDPSGAFLHTLTITDVATGWTELCPLKNKSKLETLTALKSLRARLPFPILGIDIDNGSEFLNWTWKEYCQLEEIAFTRGRPYNKNDQCRVEQKNGAIVRRHAGYGRYEGDSEYWLLMKLSGILRLTVNYFEPSAKGKDTPKTPYRRLLESKVLKKAQKATLNETYLSLNPVTFRNELREIKIKLLQIEKLQSDF